MTLAGDPHSTTTAVSNGPESNLRTEEPNDLSIVGALNVLLQHRALIVVCAAVTFLIVELALFLLPRSYSSVSSFIPQSRRSTPSIVGLAAQFGLAVPGGELGQSPAFYSDLIRTREILGAVVDSRYSDFALGRRDSVTLVEVLGEGPRTPPLQREAAIRKLRNAVNPDVSLKTGVVELTVVTRYAGLSKQVNKKILDLVNEFNLEKRQSQAALERRFVEHRLEEARLELRAAEDRLQVFLQRNATWRGSPELSFAYDRLEREITMQQQLYTSLGQAFDQAKIDEIRDSPMITIIEQPQTPLLPEGKGYFGKGLIALVAGTLLGVFIAFARQAVRHGRVGSTAELSRFRDLFWDATRPWRRRQSNTGKPVA
jgi:uncharacterized protein involved in exopolysaccharide biosynthesis